MVYSHVNNSSRRERGAERGGREREGEGERERETERGERERESSENDKLCRQERKVNPSFVTRREKSVAFGGLMSRPERYPQRV